MPESIFLHFPSESKILLVSIYHHKDLKHHDSPQLLLKVTSTRGLTIEKDPIPEASSLRKGKK